MVAMLIVNRDATFLIGRDATGNDHANTACGALGIERRHPLKSVGHFFQARMHRPHNRSIFKGGKAEI